MLYADLIFGMQLLVTAVSDLDGSCGAGVITSGVTDGNALDATPADVFECTIGASAVPAAFARDVIVTATQAVTTSACEEPAEAFAAATAMVCCRRCACCDRAHAATCRRGTCRCRNASI